MSGSLTKKRIEVQFTLQPVRNAATGVTTTPVFAESRTNRVVITGPRVQALIIKAGGFSQGRLQLRCFGISESIMNQISTLGKIPLAGRNNAITVLAGDDVAGMGVVFVGTIANAWANYQAIPEVALEVTAQSGLSAALAPATPSSFRGAADVATIMSSLANQMGRTFENNGVQVQLSNPYFPGTLLDQVHACAAAANIDFDDDGRTLAIWPKTGFRGGAIPLINPGNGMVGYPAFTQAGIALTTRFNPSVVFGGLIQVETDLAPARGRWRVFSVAHQLESETPGGPWFTTVEAADPAYAPVR